MDKNSTIEIQNGIINMLLEKIESLEAEITQLNNLINNTSHTDDDADQQLRDDVARIKHMLFGDPYPLNNRLDER